MTAPRTGPLMRAHGERGPGVEQGRRRHPRHDVDGGPHVDQDGLGGAEPAQRLPVGGVDLVPPERRDRVGGRRAPVHAAHGDAAAAERVGEEIHAGVDDAELGAEQPALSGHGALPRDRAPARRPGGSSGRRGRPPSGASPSWSASP